MRTIVKLGYVVFALVFLVAGSAVLLVRTDWLPDTLAERVVAFGEGDPNALHLMQEFGALQVFAGLMTLWFVRHYERSAAFHWAMTTFWALFALVHWCDARGPYRSLTGPIINTVPLVVFLALGVLRTRAVRRERAIGH